MATLRQEFVTSDLDLGGVNVLVVGAISETKFVTYEDGTFRVWETNGLGVVELDSVLVDDPYGLGPFNSMDGVIAYCDTVLGAWHFISDGSPWTLEINTVFSQVATHHLFVAGDQSEAVGSDGTNVFGVPMDGSTTANWSCAQGTGRLVGAPRQNRWLRMSGTGDTDGMTVELMDDTGASLDSVTFTHPPDSYWDGGGGSGADQADSLLSWVQLAEGMNTYLGCTRALGPTFEVTAIHYRTLVTTGDTLAWYAAEETFAPDWFDDGGNDLKHPVASSWLGKLAVGFVEDQFS